MSQRSWIPPTSSTEGVPVTDWEPQPVLHGPSHQHLHRGTLSSLLPQHFSASVHTHDHPVHTQDHPVHTHDHSVHTHDHSVHTHDLHLPPLHCTVWNTGRLLAQHWGHTGSWGCLCNISWNTGLWILFEYIFSASDMQWKRFRNCERRVHTHSQPCC